MTENKQYAQLLRKVSIIVADKNGYEEIFKQVAGLEALFILISYYLNGAADRIDQLDAEIQGLKVVKND